jgi:hypothetical protein
MAIMSLVNLMRRRRINLENELRQQFEKERLEAQRRQEELDRKAQEAEKQQQFEDYIRRMQKEAA